MRGVILPSDWTIPGGNVNDLQVEPVGWPYPGRLATKPRDAVGRLISALLPLDEMSSDAVSQNSMSYQNLAVGDRALGIRVGWSSAVKVFGAAAMRLLSNGCFLALPPNATLYNNLNSFTIDLRVNFDAITGTQRIVSERISTIIGSSRFDILRNLKELNFVTYDAAGLSATLATTGDTLAAGLWYALRFSYNLLTTTVRIGVNGVQAASSALAKALQQVSAANLVALTFGGLYMRDVAGPYVAGGGLGYIDEIILYPDWAWDGTTYTPPVAAIAPFNASTVVTGTYDSGRAGTVHEMDTFTTPFTSGLTFRVNADDDNTPVFSGDKLTLAQVQALDNLTGRYFHVEVTFTSDGDTRVALDTLYWDHTESSSLPHQPVLSNYNRPPLEGEHAGDSNYATVDVAGVDEDETVHAWFQDMLESSTALPFVRASEIGSLAGPGTMTLDYTGKDSNVLGIQLQPVIFISERDGAFSLLGVANFGGQENYETAVAGPLGWLYGELVTASNIHRLADPTQIEITLSDAPEGTVFNIAWTNPDNMPGYKEDLPGNGIYTLTDMETDYRYGFVVVGVTPAKHSIYAQFSEPALPSGAGPSIIPRRAPEIVRR